MKLVKIFELNQLLGPIRGSAQCVKCGKYYTVIEEHICKIADEDLDQLVIDFKKEFPNKRAYHKGKLTKAFIEFKKNR